MVVPYYSGSNHLFLFLDSRDKNQSEIYIAYFFLGVQRLDTLCLRLLRPRLQLTCDLEQKCMQPCIKHTCYNAASRVLSGTFTHQRCEQGDASAGGIESSCDVCDVAILKSSIGAVEKAMETVR